MSPSIDLVILKLKTVSRGSALGSDMQLFSEAKVIKGKLFSGHKSNRTYYLSRIPTAPFMKTPPTTSKIPGPMHGRLKQSARATGQKKSLMLRLAVEVGLPIATHSIAGLKGRKGKELHGVGLVVDDRQLDELRTFYKSAVTDRVAGVEDHEGKDFVRAVELLLPAGLDADQEAHVRRFLAVYAQLFE